MKTKAMRQPRLLPVFVAVLLGGVVPGTLLLNMPGKASLAFYTMYAFVGWIVLRMVAIGMRGKRRLTIMAYYIFMYVFMGIQPLLSIWSDLFPHYDVVFPQEKQIFTIGVLALGTLAFELGYMRFKKNALYQQVSPPRPVGEKQPTSVSLFLLWIAIVADTVLVLASIARYGPNIYLGLRDGGFSIGDFQGPESTQAENLLVIFGLRGLTASLLFITIYFWKYRAETIVRRRFRILKLALWYLILFNIVVSNPLNAPRLWSGSILLTCIFMTARWKGAKSFLTWSASACVALLLLFSGTDPRRILGHQLLNDGEITLEGTANGIVTSIQNTPADANFDAFQLIAYTKDYTDIFGYSFGKQMLLPAFFWVPRSVWEDKPIGTPDIIAEWAQFASLNVSSPLWSEGYINFGLAGIVAFLFVFGYFARMCDDSLAKPGVRTAFNMMCCCFFASNTFILLRGDLTSGTMYLQLVFGLNFLLLLFLRNKPRKGFHRNSFSASA